MITPSNTNLSTEALLLSASLESVSPPMCFLRRTCAAGQIFYEIKGAASKTYQKRLICLYEKKKFIKKNAPQARLIASKTYQKQNAPGRILKKKILHLFMFTLY